MIISNIEVNKNKLEEFVRVLLNEKYEILFENSQEDVIVDVIQDDNFIKVVAKLVDKKNRGVKNIVESTYRKISEKYFDQGEVMLKTSLLKLFGKSKSYMWGALIGVRPTKIVRRFLKMNLSYDEIEDILENIYYVSKNKIKLLISIVKRQEKYFDKDSIGIYIGIAFCPTKCSYCSFPAYLLKGKYKERYSEYIEALYNEVREMGLFIKELGLKINTIYIGGGTPSILSASEIEILLQEINNNFNLSYLREFTFEAGRIDTLDEIKMNILKKYGVDKISINPQSFNEKTLKLVNRYHNKEQFDFVYSVAKKLKLKINMDLILGLPRENTEDILYTIDTISKYDIDNLTIHNLAIKNGSKLNKENYTHRDIIDFNKIYEKIYEVTKNKKMYPYYMYRQKNSFQWGENIGYSKENCDSIYNIEMIEENKTVIGIGAGAITKLIWNSEGEERENIRRLINPKDPLVWIDELKERLDQKKGEINKIFINN